VELLTIFTFLVQVYGFITSTDWLCTRFYDPGKWLLSAQMYEQFFGGMVLSISRGEMITLLIVVMV